MYVDAECSLPPTHVAVWLVGSTLKLFWISRIAWSICKPHNCAPSLSGYWPIARKLNSWVAIGPYPLDAFLHSTSPCWWKPTAPHTVRFANDRPLLVTVAWSIDRTIQSGRDGKGNMMTKEIFTYLQKKKGAFGLSEGKKPILMRHPSSFKWVGQMAAPAPPPQDHRSHRGIRLLVLPMSSKQKKKKQEAKLQTNKQTGLLHRRLFPFRKIIQSPKKTQS